MWIAVAVSLAASLTPWGEFLLYPFKLFTTWVHECGHALMTVLVGGTVTAITIEPDTSGLTRSLAPIGRVSRGLIASSGYLGDGYFIGEKSTVIACVAEDNTGHGINASNATVVTNCSTSDNHLNGIKTIDGGIV